MRAMYMFAWVLFVYKVHIQLYMLSGYLHIKVLTMIAIKTDISFAIKLMSCVMEQDIFM